MWWTDVVLSHIFGAISSASYTLSLVLAGAIDLVMDHVVSK